MILLESSKIDNKYTKGSVWKNRTYFVVYLSLRYFKLCGSGSSVKGVLRVSEQTYLYCYQNLSEFMFSQYGSSDEKVTWTSRDKVFLLSLIGTAYHSHGNSPRPSSCVSHVFVTRLVYARQLCKGGRVLKIGKREG